MFSWIEFFVNCDCIFDSFDPLSFFFLFYLTERDDINVGASTSAPHAASNLIPIGVCISGDAKIVKKMDEFVAAEKF